MTIHDMKQGSAEWLYIRSQYPTSSEFNQLVSPVKLKVREGKSIASYVATKLAEKWLGHPLQSFGGSGDMDQGSLREHEARPWYALEFGCEVATPGFITNEHPGIPCGCSPDGLILAGKRGLEIKCPAANTHIGYLLANELPNDYLLQVQGSMLVTGYDHWTFLSYYPRMPQLVIDVERDTNVCDAIGEGLETFWKMFKCGWDRLIERNDGEEPAASLVDGQSAKDLTPEQHAWIKEHA